MILQEDSFLKSYGVHQNAVSHVGRPYRRLNISHFEKVYPSS
jgi:hypothetical protein